MLYGGADALPAAAGLADTWEFDGAGWTEVTLTPNGGTDLLGLFRGAVWRFDGTALGDNGLPLKIPHMGWSPVDQSVDHPLWQGIDSGSRFYFVHSYHVTASLLMGITSFYLRMPMVILNLVTRY